MDTRCKKLLWVTLVFILAYTGKAQEKVSKKIEKVYALNNDGELHLENKYGNVNIFGWDKDEISILVEVAVNHRKRENAEQLLQRIHPIIQEGNNYVSLNYEIREKNSSWFSSFFEKANPFDFDRSNIQIDYTIYLPQKAELKLTNTFGDVILDDWSGKLDAIVEHGDLWINQDLNKADITIRYGKVRANDIGYGTLDLKNGELTMENSNNLRINSSGTEISIDKVTSFEFYSNKDDVRLEEAGTIYGTMKFSTLELDRLVKEADMTLRVADFRVSKIIEADTEIAIEQVSSEINLNISGFSHRFEATLEQGLVRLPKAFENIDSKILDKGKKLREIKATYGKDQLGTISITGTKGLVLLKE